MISEALRQTIVEIATDRTSGAHEIANKCVIAFANYAQNIAPSASLSSIRADLQSAVSILISGQPSMASLLRICNEILLEVERAPTALEAVTILGPVIKRNEEYISRAEANLTDQFLEYTQGLQSIVTLSYSSTIAAALRAAGSAGRTLSVTVLESRPALEGRRLAIVAAEAGLQVSLAVDGAAYAEMKQADMWISGADALLPNGLVNKVGTAPLAAAAQVQHKPGIILAETLKIWPASLAYPPFASFPAIEVWLDSPPTVNIPIHYFETIPWSMITGVLCEEGLLSQSEVKDKAESLKISSFIARYFV